MGVCNCGCGGQTREGNQYISGHNRRGVTVSNIMRERNRASHLGKGLGSDNSFYGQHHTQETRQTQREANLGRTPWNKEIPLTKKHITHISMGRRGIPYRK